MLLLLIVVRNDQNRHCSGGHAVEEERQRVNPMISRGRGLSRGEVRNLEDLQK
jgi:hypothetical protein